MKLQPNNNNSNNSNNNSIKRLTADADQSRTKRVCNKTMLVNKTKYSFWQTKKNSKIVKKTVYYEDDENMPEKLITIALSWFADDNRRRKYKKNRVK